MKRFWAGLAVALACTSFPPKAQAAENIACIDQGYTPDEIAEVDRYYDGFQISETEGGPPPELMTAITRRAGECADTHGWPPDAIEDAVFYRVSLVLRTALERRSPLTPSQMRRVTEAIAAADPSRLDRIIGGIEEAALNGAAASEPSESDSIFMGRLFLRSGVPMTQSNAEYVGALIAARAMGERWRRRFAER